MTFGPYDWYSGDKICLFNHCSSKMAFLKYGYVHTTHVGDTMRFQSGCDQFCGISNIYSSDPATGSDSRFNWCSIRPAAYAMWTGVLTTTNRNSHASDISHIQYFVISWMQISICESDWQDTTRLFLLHLCAYFKISVKYFFLTFNIKKPTSFIFSNIASYLYCYIYVF